MVGCKKLDWKLAGFLLCGILLCIAPARANDINWDAAFALMGRMVMSVVIAYAVSTFIVEGIILNLLLKQGWWRSFAYATIANIVSGGIGWLWYQAQGGIWGAGGWKHAFVIGGYDRLALLFVRSYLITVAEETVVIALILSKRVQFRNVFTAVAITNVISYVLTAILIVVMMKGSG